MPAMEGQPLASLVKANLHTLHTDNIIQSLWDAGGSQADEGIGSNPPQEKEAAKTLFRLRS